jgi:hypothetical protein
LLETWQGARPEWILEPFAGEGAIVRELREWAPNAKIEAWDCRDVDVLGEPLAPRLRKAGANIVITGRDALSCAWPDRANQLVITNPPFALAEEVFALALTCAQSRIALLERVAFLCGGRNKVLGAKPPDVALLPNRPSFAYAVECACERRIVHPDAIDKALEDMRLSCVCEKPIKQRMTTDSSEYAWFCWGAAPRERAKGELWWLQGTPLEERKR